MVDTYQEVINDLTLSNHKPGREVALEMRNNFYERVPFLTMDKVCHTDKPPAITKNVFLKHVSREQDLAMVHAMS